MNITPQKFAVRLVEWWRQNPRELPWKMSRDPYMVWVSEIILQQTRVAQGTPYFLRFLAAFPDIKSLAAAEEEEVLKLWEGLGYYSRARNMLHTAKIVCNDHDGKFPDTYEDILRLKGIGPYTAAALASFAFGLRHAVIDGNVLRVVSRVAGIPGTPDDRELRQRVSLYVTEAIEHADPEEYNQAIMDLGATVCLPSSPACIVCPVKDGCVAFREGLTGEIPAKKLRPAKKTRFMHYFDISVFGDCRILQRREAGDIWQGLFQFPLIGTEGPDTPTNAMVDSMLAGIFEGNLQHVYKPAFVFKKSHVLTHRIIEAHFYELKVNGDELKIKTPYYLVENKKVGNFAFPKIFKDYFDSQKNDSNGK